MAVLFHAYLVSLLTTMSGMELFSSLLLIALVFRKKNFSEIRWQSPLLPLILCFCAVVILGVILGSASLSDKVKDLGRIRFFLFFVLFATYFREPLKEKKWEKTIAWVALIVGVYSFFQHFFSFDLIRPPGKKVLLFADEIHKVGPLVVGFFNHHLTCANIFLLYACLFFSAGENKKYLKTLGVFYFLLSIWTQSRMLWLAVPVCLTILLWHRKKQWLLAVLMGTLAAGVWFNTDAGIRTRLEAFSRLNSEKSYTDRIRLWKIQKQLFLEAPLLGVGWNNNERQCKQKFTELFPHDSDFFCGHAHSLYLQVLTTTGLVGFVLFFGIWFCLFRHLVLIQRNASSSESERNLARGLIAAFAGFLIQGVTQWNFGDAEVLHNVLFLWAIAASLGKNSCANISK